MSEQEYGSQSEGILIVIMSVVIAICIMGAWSLQGHQDCRASDYTYCGMQDEGGHH